MISDGAALLRGGTDLRSANQSPQSVGSSGMDSGVESFSDQSGDLPHIAISLCGGLTENTEITRGIKSRCSAVVVFCRILDLGKSSSHYSLLSFTEEFEERAVSYQEFADNPSIIDDPNLVVKIGTKYVRNICFYCTCKFRTHW